jgi:hypothetical protein
MAEDQSDFWFEYWSRIREPLLAGLEDIFRVIKLWTVLGIAHLVQHLFLLWGWSILVVHYLDSLEEWTAFATVIAFLIPQLGSFAWAEYRRFAKESR